MDNWVFTYIPGENNDPNVLATKRKYTTEFHFSILTLTPWHFLFSWRAHIDMPFSYFFFFQVISSDEMECCGVIKEQGLENLATQKPMVYPNWTPFFPKTYSGGTKFRVKITTPDDVKQFIGEMTEHLSKKP
jgi:hypothetical protein